MVEDIRTSTVQLRNSTSVVNSLISWWIWPWSEWFSPSASFRLQTNKHQGVPSANANRAKKLQVAYSSKAFKVGSQSDLASSSFWIFVSLIVPSSTPPLLSFIRTFFIVQYSPGCILSPYSIALSHISIFNTLFCRFGRHQLACVTLPDGCWV